MSYNISIGLFNKAPTSEHALGGRIQRESMTSPIPDELADYRHENVTMPSQIGWEYTMALANLVPWRRDLRSRRFGRKQITANDVAVIQTALESLKSRRPVGPLCAFDRTPTTVSVQFNDRNAWDHVPIEHASPDAYGVAIQRLAWMLFWMRGARSKYKRHAYIRAL